MTRKDYDNRPLWPTLGSIPATACREWGNGATPGISDDAAKCQSTDRYRPAVPDTQQGLQRKLNYVSRRAHSLYLSVYAISQYGTGYTAQREGGVGRYDYCLLGYGFESYADSYKGFGGPAVSVFRTEYDIKLPKFR